MGRALKHLYALRLLFRKGSLIDANNVEQPQRFEEPAGNLVDITIAKTKVSKPDRRVGFYTLKYEEGIDILSDMVDMAVKYNAIRQSGAWFQIIDIETGEIMADDKDEPLKFQGKAKLLAYLRENGVVYEMIKEQVEKIMNE
jgi:recombination protein RecA